MRHKHIFKLNYKYKIYNNKTYKQSSIYKLTCIKCNIIFFPFGNLTRYFRFNFHSNSSLDNYYVAQRDVNNRLKIIMVDYKGRKIKEEMCSLSHDDYIAKCIIE